MTKRKPKTVLKEVPLIHDNGEARKELAKKLYFTKRLIYDRLQALADTLPSKEKAAVKKTANEILGMKLTRLNFLHLYNKYGKEIDIEIEKELAEDDIPGLDVFS